MKNSARKKCIEKKTMHRIKIVMITVLCIIVVNLFVLMPLASVIIYSSIFSVRFETSALQSFSTEDFDMLSVEECSFNSNKGQSLAGYKYTSASEKEILPKGVVVIAHGLGGGGQKGYMNVADYFVSNGYYVFAYDATGNDNSPGDGAGGLPQGIADLDYALRYVKQQKEYNNLPIVIFGHSWGGYAAGAVLNYHSDIKAVVSVAGFDSSADMLKEKASAYVGDAVEVLSHYVLFYDKMLHGEYSSATAIDGFKNSNAKIMIVQSSDDTSVVPEIGYDKYYDEFKEDSRFTFVMYKDRGHNHVYNSAESKEYRTEYDSQHENIEDSVGSDFCREMYYDLDDELMEKILAMYDSCCLDN